MVIKNKVLLEINADDIKNGTCIIPPSVKEIDSNVFHNYVTLTHIEIPDSVEKIGNSAFSYCVNLKSVKLPKNLKELEFSTFEDCYSLEEINIPDSVETLGSDIFNSCRSLKNITLPKKISRIPSFCFHNCTALETIKIPKNVKIIAQSAFENCSSLKNIDIPKTLEDIGSEAFYNCSSLERIRLPEKMNSIDEGAFQKCSSLKYFIFPKGLSYIDNKLFEDCVSLEEIHFCGDLYNVHTSAFKNCYSLKKIELPETVNNISRFAFDSCTSLETFKTPLNLTSINEGCFQNCTSLKSFNIPIGVQVISDSAFENCTSLETINIPHSVTSIGEDAFTNCESLQSLQIPNSVKSLKEFDNDSLLFFTKNPDGFLLSNTREKSSIPIKDIKFDLALLSKNWDYKNLLLLEQRNPFVSDFYESFLLGLTADKIIDFIPNHNFTFFKQLKLEPAKKNIYVYKFLYNIGALEEPVTDFIFDENNMLKGSKTTDYAQKTVEFIKDRLKKDNITIYDFVKPFTNMPANGFNREFTDFFLKNYDELIKENNKQPNFITNCYKNFYEVQRTNTSNHGSQRQLKPTVEKFRLYFATDKFKGVTEETKTIAKTIAPYFDNQSLFDSAVEINNERIKKKVKNNILSSPLSEKDIFSNIGEYETKIVDAHGKLIENLVSLADNEFSFEWLEKNDPQNFILGKLCSCCSHLDGAGYGIMRAGIIHPYVQNLVIKNNSGDIVAKSTLYVNHKKRYGVCNNVEVRNGIVGDELQEIYEKFLLAINAFAINYNKENPKRPLKQINVGMGRNDIYDQIVRNGHRSSKILSPINYKKYGDNGHYYNGDSSERQYAIWINQNNQKEKEKI